VRPGRRAKEPAKGGGRSPAVRQRNPPGRRMVGKRVVKGISLLSSELIHRFGFARAYGIYRYIIAIDIIIDI